jgi:DNA-binding NarL/FixJ family response regulator
MGRPTLTPREQVLLERLAHGEKYRDIARDLFVSISTVKGTARDLFDKLGARTAAHAVHIAHETGLLPAGGPPEQVADLLARALAAYERERGER